MLQRIPKGKRAKVEEVTLDLAATMERIVTRSFPKAKLVSDRFHVQQLATEAVQQLRVEYRWLAIDQGESGNRTDERAGPELCA